MRPTRSASSAAERERGIQAVPYEDDVHPYTDLVIGRVDAVVLDNVLAERRRRFISGFTVQPETIAVGHYIGVLSAANAPLRDAINYAPEPLDPKALAALCRRHGAGNVLAMIEIKLRRAAGR